MCQMACAQDSAVAALAEGPVVTVCGFDDLPEAARASADAVPGQSRDHALPIRAGLPSLGTDQASSVPAHIQPSRKGMATYAVRLQDRLDLPHVCISD